MAGRGHCRRRARGTSAGPPRCCRTARAAVRTRRRSTGRPRRARRWPPRRRDRRARRRPIRPAPARGAGAARTSARSPAAGTRVSSAVLSTATRDESTSNASASVAAAPSSPASAPRSRASSAENGPGADAEPLEQSRRVGRQQAVGPLHHRRQAAVPLGPAKARADQHVRALAQSGRGSPRAASSGSAPPRARARAAPRRAGGRAPPPPRAGRLATIAPASRARSRNSRTASVSSVRRARRWQPQRAEYDERLARHVQRRPARGEHPGRLTGRQQRRNGVGRRRGDVLAVVDQHQSGLLGRRVDQRVEARETQLRGDRTGDVLRDVRRPSGRRRGHPTRSRRSRGAEPTSRGRSCRSRPDR